MSPLGVQDPVSSTCQSNSQVCQAMLLGSVLIAALLVSTLGIQYGRAYWKSDTGHQVTFAAGTEKPMQLPVHALNVV